MTLRVKELDLVRGSQSLQSQLSFDVERGQALWLRGPNGVGKSTLIETLVGLRRIEAGQISWNNQDIGDDLDQYQHALAYVGHKNANSLAFTPQQILDFYRDLAGVGDSVAALEISGLAHRRDVPAIYLSAGQQRRLALARLLMVKRELWFLDEPTTSLDLEGVNWFSNIVNDHLRGGGIAVFASHVTLPIENLVTLDLTRLSAQHQAQANLFVDGDWDAVL